MKRTCWRDLRESARMNMDFRLATRWLVDFILSSPSCRIIRFLLGLPEYLPARELISRNVLQPNSDPLPPRFLEKFKELPTVVLAEVFRHLECEDIFRLQLADRRFWYFIRDHRELFPVIHIGKTLIELNGLDSIRVFRDFHDRENVSVNLFQLAQSFRAARFTILVIYCQGHLNSDVFHVSHLNCCILELRILESMTSETEKELITLFERIINNSSIKIIDMVVRTSSDNAPNLELQLKSIVAKSQYLEPKASSRITVVPC